jgi:hypothetical protein
MGWIGAAMGLLGLSSAGKAKEPPAFPARPQMGKGEEAALSAARLWLMETIQRDVAGFALGEERRFTVDQPGRTLTLAYADGESLIVQVEALGSFNPYNRTFRWAWSNTSIESPFAKLSEAARTHPDVRNFPSFSAPIFEATFEACTDLVALAARLSGCDGVYRAIAEDNVTVFLGYRLPPAADLARFWPSGQAAERDVLEARDQIVAYDAAMLPFDVEYNARYRSGGEDAASAEDRATILDDISLRQQQTHLKFWRRDDDDWDPPLSWPSPHDPQTRRFLIAAPRRAGGVYVIRGGGSYGRDAFVLERHHDGMRIVDNDVEWGAGLLLP